MACPTPILQALRTELWGTVEASFQERAESLHHFPLECILIPGTICHTPAPVL